MAIPGKHLRGHNRLHGAGQSIKHNANAEHHEHRRKNATQRCVGRDVAKSDRRDRLCGHVKTIKYRPAFEQAKCDGSKRHRSQNRQQDDADASPTREKETRQGCYTHSSRVASKSPARAAPLTNAASPVKLKVDRTAAGMLRIIGPYGRSSSEFKL